MNRRERRRAHRAAPAAFRAIASTYRCPDCDSVTTEPYPDHARGIWRITVSHDETCPWYRQNIESRKSP